ncbi:hypothetical protein OEZ86_008748 [Tetradesmus obliquus]|nr:hypothetical protein OEZ86_008748 [Tetradesmus obliquus]
MSPYVNVVIVSFAKPDCSYTKGSFQLTGTGLDFSSDGTIVRDAITALKTANPNTRVLLAVGGATYYNFAGTRPQCIKDIIDDFGFDGMDFDWEPVNSNCVVKPGGGVSCATDAEGVSVLAALRAALPKRQYLMSTASWHVGMYGEGAFVSSKPASAYTGVNLAMAKSAAGQSLDLINIMAYDAGNTASTGFDWSESYRAHRAIWQSQAIAVGVEIPPEAWGGNVITLPQVVERANYVKSSSTSGPYGIMLWSLHKTGCPNAQQITSAVCSTFGMAGCSTPLPFTHLFDQIFLHRNDPACSSNGFYTYSAFVAAAAAFPGFGTAADAATNKRELAAFLAQISHETTGGWATAPDGPYSWGLCWIQEGMKTPADQMAPYCAESAEYPCAPGKKYFGRGPMQLSWNYNYIPAGQALGFDGLNNPDAVTQDAVLAFKTAIWFWMTPRDPKPSCHAVMTGSWTPNPADMAVGRLPGFGLTTNIINGGLECSGTGTVQGQELDRIGYFKRYAALFGVDTGSNLDCSRQQHY